MDHKIYFMRISFWIVLFFSLVRSFHISGQSLKPLNIPFTSNGHDVLNPWTGGMNTPQIYNADLNRDGVQDVLILDRDGDQLIPLLRIDGQYVYAEEYKDNFGTVREWMVIRDYNGDGIEDMFTLVTPVPGIFVKKGEIIDGQLHMKDVELDNTNNILFAQQFTTYTNISVNFGDQPEIIDVDGDGDVDVLNFEGGGSYIWYYKNYAVERGLGLDAFEFELEDLCWGKFLEAEFTQEVLLSDTSTDCAEAMLDDEDPSLGLRHSGSCVTAFDNDGDGDLDMFLGDLASSNIVYLENGGDNQNAFITAQDATFPSYDVPVEIDIFNAAFHTDVNGDGKRDFLAAPNNEGSFENHNCLWYYENVGTDENPTFEYRQSDLFVKDMIDLGSHTRPAFVDIDQDGLLDLVVGTSGEFTNGVEYDRRLVYFRNIGSKSDPKFELSNDDFMNFRSIADNTLFRLAPSFGDLDGDDDIDLVVGTGSGYLFYFENIAGANNPMDFAPGIYKFMDIQPGSLASPLIYDLDQDGLGDLIVGEQNGNVTTDGIIGSVSFYKNIGTVGNPMFDSDLESAVNNPVLGEINTFVLGSSRRSSSPSLAVLENETVLLVGSEGGQIFGYHNIVNQVSGIFDAFNVDFELPNQGVALTATYADINNNGKLDVVFGNLRGGLSIYETSLDTKQETSTTETKTESEYSIQNNPVYDELTINVDSVENLECNIYDVQGRLILHAVRIGNNIDVSKLISGVYFLELKLDNQYHVLKFVKE